MAGLLTDSSLQTPSHLFEAVAAFACPEFWKSQQRVLLPREYIYIGNCRYMNCY